MKLIVEQSGASFDVPDKGALFIGNDEDCHIQINRPEIWGRHAAVNVTDYGCVLELESSSIIVNGIPIKSKCLLYAGDEIKVADLALLLVDDNYIPKAVNMAGEPDQSLNSEELSSVFGLRQQAGEHNGSFIKSDFQHPDGWTIYRNGAKMALLANNQSVYVNGRQVESTWLKNGDRIQYRNERLSAECPGHSGYSKFSPSHPRNVMLSEALTDSETEEYKKPELKTHYWWITLVAGLLVLMAVILLR